MAGERMIERVGAQRLQRRDRRRRHHAVDEHGDTLVARGKTGAEDGGELAAAECRRNTERIVEHIGMARERRLYSRALPGKPIIVDAGAEAGKAGAAAEQSAGKRRRGGRVADAHLAEHDEIGRIGDVVVAGRDRLQERGLGHGGCNSEIGGRLLQRQRHHAKLGVARAGKLIDGRAAACEVRHHLGRDLRRIGGDALRRHAMIAGKDQDLDPVEDGRIAALPQAKPGHRLFQAPQASGRLGQPRFAPRHGLCHILVALREIEAGGAQVRKGSKSGHLG